MGWFISERAWRWERLRPERPADRFDRVAFSSSPLFLTKRNMSTIAFCHLSALRVKTRGRGVGAPDLLWLIKQISLGPSPNATDSTPRDQQRKPLLQYRVHDHLTVKHRVPCAPMCAKRSAAK